MRKIDILAIGIGGMLDAAIAVTGLFYGYVVMAVVLMALYLVLMVMWIWYTDYRGQP